MGLLSRVFASFTAGERRVFWVAVALLALSMCVAVFSIAFWRSGTPTFGGQTLVEGAVGQPKDPNPVLAATDVDRTLVRLVFSSLSDVASKIEEKQASNATVWRIRLKEAVLWHDGKRLTSDDVIFTIARIQEEDSKSPLAPVWRGVKVARVSELELEVTLPSSYVFFPAAFSQLFIAPKHIYADVPTANWHLSTYHLQPVGSGMYEFASYDRLASGFISTYRLKSSARYFGEHPAITTLSFSFYPNATELYRAYDAGVVDAFGAPDTHFDAVVKRPYTAYSFNLPTSYALFFNQSKARALSDVRVRQAMNLALNRTQMVSHALGGHGQVSVFPAIDGLAPATASTAPEEAATMLDAAGYKLNASGTRAHTDKTGTATLAFTLTTPQIDFLQDAAHDVAADLARIGIHITVVPASVADIAASALKNRDYEILLFGTTLSPTQDLFAFWHSSARFAPGLNIAVYNNKQLDTLLEVIRRTSDPAQRIEQFNAIRTLLLRELPATYLFSPTYNYVTATTVSGVEAGTLTDPSQHFAGIAKWSVKGVLGI